MIQAFYHFKTSPFGKDIKGDDVFLSAGSRELFQRLEYMKEKRGIMLLTGMPGTGKTFHLRTFVEKLNPNFYEYFYFPLSTVNTLDFYRQLALALGGEAAWRKSQLFCNLKNYNLVNQRLNHKIKIPAFTEWRK